MSISVKEWNMIEMPDYPCITLLGKRRSGKSTLIKDIVKNYFYKKKYPNIIVVSPTAKFNEDYKWLEQKYIVPDFSEDLIDSILDRQKKLVENDPKGNNSLLLIIDDMVMDNSNFMNNNARVLSKLYVLGRHYKIAILNSTQILKGGGTFTPSMRTNTDIMICFISPNKDDKKYIEDTWLKIDGDSSIGQSLVDNIPNDNFRVMIIDNSKITMDYEKFVYYYTGNVISKNWKYKFHNY